MSAVDDVGELEVLALHLRRHQRQNLFDPVAQLELDHFQRGLASVDLREGEDVVDQGEQHVGGVACSAHVVELAAGQIHLDDQIQHADHAIQRCAQFVADGRGELALGTGRIEGLVAGDLECLALLDRAIARVLGDAFLFDRLVARCLRDALLLQCLVTCQRDRLFAIAQHFHHRVEGTLHVENLARALEHRACILFACLRSSHHGRQVAHRPGKALK
jgi:hypothetical protein